MAGAGTAGYSLVQSITGSALDAPMVYMAEYLVLLVPAVLVFLWFRGEEGRRDSLFAFYTVSAGITVSYLLGLLYSHQPPHLQGFETILVNDPENAFPSQHTSAVFSLAWPLAYREREKVAGAVLFAAVLTGFARVYTGLHFPVDVLGGALASVIGFGAVYHLESYAEKISSELVALWDKVFRSLVK